MLGSSTTASERRLTLRQGLESGRLLQFPGAFNPLTALLVEETGFDGIYISGAVISASLGLPDIGLTTLTEVSSVTRDITRVANLPTLVDADTGFGEPMNVARTMQTLEDAGASGCHIEDQVMPKRCGHLEGKTVVNVEEMTRRIGAAIAGRRDKNFVICARTDARSVEGLDRSIERAKAYVDAGADMIFPEALEDEAEFERFRKSIGVPLLANMTEFGKSKLLVASQLESIGINLVIYPVTLLRIAMGAVEDCLREIRKSGTQAEIVPKMQTRSRLYELLDYEAYNTFDSQIFNFHLPDKEAPNE